MKLVLIVGSGAVGKMTVGQQLMKTTDLRLFHNHMSIEPVVELFGTYVTHVVHTIRDFMIDEFLKTESYGLIFTKMIDFDNQEDLQRVSALANLVSEDDFYFVELHADLSTRLERNKTQNRLMHKKSKSNLEFSENIILDCDKKYREVSHDGEVKYKNYLKIDNTNLSAEQAAELIKTTFNL